VRAIILAATLTLAGCGVYHWHKDGADNAAFQRDSAECGKPGSQPAAGQTQPDVSPFEACMNARGWTYSSGW
jgi:hypothetical protein